MAWTDLETPLKNALDAKIGSGIAAGVGRITPAGTSEVLLKTYLGKTRGDEQGKPIDQHSYFDLASLTKVFGTTTVIAKMVAEGQLSIDEDIKLQFPELEKKWNKQSPVSTKISDILKHQAGFFWWIDFSKAASVASIFEGIAAYPASYTPGAKTIYSDLGMILLGEYLSRRFNKPLEELVKSAHQEQNLMFKPFSNGVPIEKIVASEMIVDRGGLLQGEVHDGNCARLGSVSGHAGLFGSLDACMSLAEKWMRSYFFSGEFFPQPLTKIFLRHYPSAGGKIRGLGWDVATPPESMAGTRATGESFSHTGYTGTSVVLDLHRKTWVVLLTNRVYPKHVEGSLTRIKNVRIAFHDMVWNEIDPILQQENKQEQKK